MKGKLLVIRFTRNIEHLYLLGYCKIPERLAINAIIAYVKNSRFLQFNSLYYLMEFHLSHTFRSGHFVCRHVSKLNVVQLRNKMICIVYFRSRWGGGVYLSRCPMQCVQEEGCESHRSLTCGVYICVEYMIQTKHDINQKFTSWAVHHSLKNFVNFHLSQFFVFILP